MRNSKADVREILAILKDIAMESKMIEQFMESLYSGQVDKGKWILSLHRSKLLSDVHAKRNQLYCMDVFIQKLSTD